MGNPNNDEFKKLPVICGENDDSHAADELDAMRERAEKAETERDALKSELKEATKTVGTMLSIGEEKALKARVRGLETQLSDAQALAESLIETMQEEGIQFDEMKLLDKVLNKQGILHTTIEPETARGEGEPEIEPATRQSGGRI